MAEAASTAPGVGLGLEFRKPVLTKGLEWAISLQGLTNAVSATEVTNFFRKELNDTVAVELETGAWFHIPVFTGLTYVVDLGTTVKIHATAQAGLNITRQMSAERSTIEIESPSAPT